MWIDARRRFCCASSDATVRFFASSSRERLFARALQLLELLLPLLHGTLEAERLPAQSRVLVRQHLRRLGAVDDLREALRARDHVDCARRAVHVERIEPLHDPLLRGVEVALRDVQPVLVLPQAPLDQIEPLLRVPRLILDDLQMLSDLAHLREHGRACAR